MPATHREPEAAATGELAPEGGPGSDDRAASAAGQGAGSRAGRRPSKATLILLAKIAVGAFLCAVIAAGVDWRGALRSLA
ncbi:MAG: hypothetical protein JXB36_08990, partial [Gammaproteobacteria bacterium]|nr:hypothetical protein [Gammaproteobacteria bacterium]